MGALFWLSVGARRAFACLRKHLTSLLERHPLDVRSEAAPAFFSTSSLLFHPWCPGGERFAVNFRPEAAAERKFFSSRGFLFPERSARKLRDVIAFRSVI